MVTMTCLNMTMAQLAERLQGYAPNYLDQPVVDLTGLNAAWDFTVSWTPRPAFDSAANRAPHRTAVSPCPKPLTNDCQSSWKIQSSRCPSWDRQQSRTKAYRKLRV
jgi:uncharacterized protein (TIGR03435 family)